MIIRVELKTPDALENAIEERLFEDCQDWYASEIDHKKSEIKEICSKWFKHSESIQLDIDTEKQTCTVVER